MQYSHRILDVVHLLDEMHVRQISEKGNGIKFTDTRFYRVFEKPSLALLNTSTMSTRLQARLRHFQRFSFILNGSAQQIDISFNVENLLLRFVQMQLNIILCLAHFGRTLIQRIIRGAPAIPNGTIHARNQRFSCAAKLSR